MNMNFEDIRTQLSMIRWLFFMERWGWHISSEYNLAQKVEIVEDRMKPAWE